MLIAAALLVLLIGLAFQLCGCATQPTPPRVCYYADTMRRVPGPSGMETQRLGQMVCRDAQTDKEAGK